MNTCFRSSWLIGGWIAAVAILTAGSVAMRAYPSTIALLVALGLAAGLVGAFLADGASAPTVSQMLHAVETKDGRS